MVITSLVKNLPADPAHNGWVLGWAVIQMVNWRFVDIFASRDAAKAKVLGMGIGHTIRYGSHRPGTESFIPLSPPGKA